MGLREIEDAMLLGKIQEGLSAAADGITELRQSNMGLSQALEVIKGKVEGIGNLVDELRGLLVLGSENYKPLTERVLLLEELEKRESGNRVMSVQLWIAVIAALASIGSAILSAVLMGGKSN